MFACKVVRKICCKFYYYFYLRSVVPSTG